MLLVRPSRFEASQFALSYEVLIPLNLFLLASHLIQRMVLFLFGSRLLCKQHNLLQYIILHPIESGNKPQFFFFTHFTLFYIWSVKQLHKLSLDNSVSIASGFWLGEDLERVHVQESGGMGCPSREGGLENKTQRTNVKMACVHPYSSLVSYSLAVTKKSYHIAKSLLG